MAGIVGSFCGVARCGDVADPPGTATFTRHSKWRFRHEIARLLIRRFQSETETITVCLPLFVVSCVDGCRPKRAIYPRRHGSSAAGFDGTTQLCASYTARGRNERLSHVYTLCVAQTELRVRPRCNRRLTPYQ